MTAAELQLIFNVARAEPEGLAATPEDLPVAEGLVEAGVLDRRMVGGEAVYTASEAFRRKALALAGHQVAAAEQARLN